MDKKLSKDKIAYALRNLDDGDREYFSQWLGLHSITLSSGSSKSRKTSDVWSLYHYGKGVYKVVYFKKTSIDKKKKQSPIKGTLTDYERFSNSLSRARSTVFEIALCNDFKYFCTFTLDKEKIDRFDLDGFRKKFTQYIRDLNKNRPENEKIRYLLIPEQHGDGAWHMHGLLMGLTESELTLNGNGYLDWNGYRKRFGFFSVSPIDNSVACAKYITKYIGKDFDNVSREKCQHLFFASKGLKRKEQICKREFEKCPIDPTSQWEFENEYLKIKWLEMPFSKERDEF